MGIESEAMFRIILFCSLELTALRGAASSLNLTTISTWSTGFFMSLSCRSQSGQVTCGRNRVSRTLTLSFHAFNRFASFSFAVSIRETSNSIYICIESDQDPRTAYRKRCLVGSIRRPDCRNRGFIGVGNFAGLHILEIDGCPIGSLVP